MPRKRTLQVATFCGPVPHQMTLSSKHLTNVADRAQVSLDMLRLDEKICAHYLFR